MMFIRRNRKSVSNSFAPEKSSSAQDAAMISKLWKENVKGKLKGKMSMNTAIKVGIKTGSRYRSSFVNLPASEMAGMVSEIWNECPQKESTSKKANSGSKEVKIEMMNIIGIDGSTKQVPSYKKIMKVLYNNAISSEEWSLNPLDAYIIDLHYDRTVTGEPVYTLLLSDGRETETDCSRIKLA